MDDQMMMRQQARELSRVSGQQNIQSPSSTKNSKKQQQQQQQQQQKQTKKPQQNLNTYDGDYGVNARPSGHAPRRNENLYTEQERNKDIDYNNIARNIDPTYQSGPPEPDYQTIGPAFKSQVGMIEVGNNPLSNVAPVNVIPNVKRSSKQSDKKKSKKLFK